MVVQEAGNGRKRRKCDLKACKVAIMNVKSVGPAQNRHGNCFFKPGEEGRKCDVSVCRRGTRRHLHAGA